jgi:hypothetical protein
VLEHRGEQPEPDQEGTEDAGVEFGPGPLEGEAR